MRAGKKNIHHARTGAAGKESFDSRRHDFCFRLARLVSRNQSPESVDDDIHRVTHLSEFLFALDRTRHVELEIERHHFEWTVFQFTVVAHRHDEIHAVHAYSFPPAFPCLLRDPLTWNLGPDVVLHPWFCFVANPSRLARKDQCWFAFERQHNVDVAVHNLKTRDIQHSAFETSILISADDQRFEASALHRGANVLVPAIDFELAWQLYSGAEVLYCTPQSSAAVKA